MEKGWASLDAFTRYTNISAADCHEIQLKRMTAQGLPKSTDALSPEAMEQLAELDTSAGTSITF